jgi:hypothetical protein
MQYAVIVQSAVQAGSTRQTAVVPDSSGTVRIFTRLGSGNRGSAGAWRETAPQGNIASERIYGQPVSVGITATDIEDLAVEPRKVPSDLLQKLVRKVSRMTTLNPDSQGLESVLERLRLEALADPEAFAVYQNSGPALVTWQPAYQQAPTVIASSPAVQVVRESEPVTSDSFQQFTVPQLSDADVSVYIPRTDVYGKSEVEVYDYARLNSEVVAIDGHAGTGKTSSARHYSALRGLPFYRVECHQSLDTSVTQGKFVPDGVGGLKWVYSPLARLIQQPSVILLNEFTRTSPKNAPLFLGLLEERQLLIDSHLGEVIPVHPETLFIADYNSGYRGTAQLDQALFDRFNVKLKFGWSAEAEAKRIPSASLREFANALRKGAELEDKFSTPVSTRLLLNFVKQSQGLSLPFAVEVFLNAFPVEEQDAIKMLFQVYSNNIASELGCSADGLNI